MSSYICICLSQVQYAFSHWLSINQLFTHPLYPPPASYLPGRRLISASGERAVSRGVHLPRLQLGGKRDSHNQREDQRSVSVPSASVKSSCLTGSKPPPSTSVFLHLASEDGALTKLNGILQNCFCPCVDNTDSIRYDTVAALSW